MLKNKDIIVVTSFNWDEPRRARYHISYTLAKKNRVLYVERPISLFKAFLHIPKYWKKILNPLRIISERLFLFAPIKIFPYDHKSFALSKINQLFIQKQIKKSARKLKMDAPILWCFSYTGGSLLGTLNEQFSIYHCCDNIARDFYPEKKKKLIQTFEGQLLREVALVFVVHDKLYDKYKDVNKNLVLSYLGVDYDTFSQALSPDLNLPDDISLYPSPRIGYVGVINYRIDVALVKHVALKHPDWSIIMIGPIEGDSQIVSNLKNLESIENIHFLGHREDEELPAYLKALDVCIIPYELNDATKYISANAKTFQYLSAGKPVVYSNLPAVKPETGMIKVAKDPDDFIVCIEDFLSQNTPEWIKRRTQRAKENSWDKKVETLSVIIQKLMRRD